MASLREHIGVLNNHAQLAQAHPATSGVDVNGKHSANRLSHPVIPRVSMEEYFESGSPANSSGEVDALEPGKMENLPSYEDAVQGQTRSRSRSVSRLTVEPREDEGREQLPGYSCSIMIQSLFHRKMEYESAVHKAKDRNWYKVFVELQGTAIRIYKVKSTGVVQTPSVASAENVDLPVWVKAGELVKSYTLQHADVGIAADYQKRRYVIRLRVETDQFLLSCLELSTFLLWLESISAAIDLSPPLDERQIPKEYSLPRRRWRRFEARPDTTITTASNTVNLNDDNLILQQHRILTSQFPQLSHPSTSQDSLSPRPTPREPLTRDLSTAGSSSENISRTPSAASSLEALHPSVSMETGKWQPAQTWTRQYDLMYAKRCMAVLLRKSPRKSNMIILRGRRWSIDWGTGRLEREDPPGYSEMSGVEKGGRKRGWSLTRAGAIIRA